MGKYINVTSSGKQLPATGKAQFLLENEPGTTIVSSKEYVPNMVAVVENGMLDAAGYMYSEREYEYFRDNTGGRRHTWLQVPNAEKLVD